MKIIANPEAGHGSASRNRSVLENCLRDKGISYRILETRHPGHARELAHGLADSGEERVLVCGGDGTISEAANGLAGSATQLGVIASGTGNDFARSLGLPHNDPRAALDVVLQGRVAEVDLGREGERYFVSTFGLGFPAVIAETANRMQTLKGPAAFFVAVYRAIYRMRAVSMKIDLDGEEMTRKCTSVLVQNTEFCGGGLRMAPGSRVDDGQLDVVVVGEIGRIDLLFNFPRVYRGKHLGHPSFSRYRARTVKIECAVPLAKMFDGDIHGETPARVTVAPKAIRVIVPPRVAA